MTETTARIRWEDIASPIDALASRGFVGKLERRSFIIYKPEFDGGQYRLLCLIGDRGGESLYADDPDELKRAAEEWLAGFVSSLGAIFGDAIAADLRSRADDLEAMVCREPGQERDNLLFAAGLKRAADLIEHGDIPATTAATTGEDQPCSH